MFDDLRRLQGDGFWYMATPYSKYKYGTVIAFEDASQIAGTLMKRGLTVFSPIAHSHAIAIHGEIDPKDHKIWMPADTPFMNAAIGLLVVEMLGWDQSYGVSQEIAHFKAAGKPVRYIRMEDLA